MFLDDRSAEHIAYDLYRMGSSNRPDRERMRRLLGRAINRELTDRQRCCLQMYYLEGMKMKDIAVALSLSRSTVSRHISAATAKLRHIASYYEQKH